MYILWVRHAYSCGNYYNQSGLIDPKLYIDPLLTNHATKQSKGMWSKINKKTKKLELIPIVFTSTLTRAIQTGELISPRNVKVIPVSYINEINIKWYYDSYNLPRNRKDVEKDLGYKLQVLKSNNPYRKSGAPKVSKPDKELFFNYGLPSIIDTLESQGIKVSNKSVLIFVSHGGFIHSITGHKVGNLGLVLQDTDTMNSKILSKGFMKPRKANVSNCEPN